MSRYYHLDHLARPAGGADECPVLCPVGYIMALKGEVQEGLFHG